MPQNGHKIVRKSDKDGQEWLMRLKRSARGTGVADAIRGIGPRNQGDGTAEGSGREWLM
jgi:hypothetical protein